MKYGYAAVGRVVEGPAELVGREVFVLHPHQDRFAAPAAMAVPLPDGRAAGAGGARREHGDGAQHRLGRGRRRLATGSRWSAPGSSGRSPPGSARRLPGTEVTLVDVNPERAALAAALGCGFALPEAAPEDCDVVIHASASGEGLATALGAAGLEATVVEASWYGDRPPTVGLGGAFHSRRLRLVVEPGRPGAGRAAGALEQPAAAGGGAAACSPIRRSTR